MKAGYEPPVENSWVRHCFLDGTWEHTCSAKKLYLGASVAN